MNKYVRPDDEIYEPLRGDPTLEAQQSDRLATLRAERDSEAVASHLEELKTAAADPASGVNLLYPMHEALRARATVGEVCNALREVWGIYEPSVSL